MEPVLDYLVEKWPIFAMLVVSVIVTAIVVWLLSEWYHRFVNTETKVDNLPCSKHDEMFDRINEKLNVINSIKEKVDSQPCSKHDEMLNKINEKLNVIDSIKEKVDSQPCSKHDEMFNKINEKLNVIDSIKEKVDSQPCSKHDEMFDKINEKLNVINSIKEKVDNLPCSKHDEMFDKINEKLNVIDSIKEKVDNLPCSKHDEMFDKINEKLNVIRTALTIGNPMLANYLSQKNSPRELSEDGKKLFTDIKGEEFLHKNKDILIKGIEDNNPKTPLDVEELSFKVLLHLIDDDMYIGMKNWVYNSSPRKILVDGIEKSYDITMLDVCFVLSLPLRNMYLELHKELL